MFKTNNYYEKKVDIYKILRFYTFIYSVTKVIISITIYMRLAKQNAVLSLRNQRKFLGWKCIWNDSKIKIYNYVFAFRFGNAG